VIGASRSSEIFLDDSILQRDRMSVPVQNSPRPVTRKGIKSFPSRVSKDRSAVIDMSKVIEFQLSGKLITLDALLKTTGIATSGGEAKAMVAAGQVDGQLELRKRCKIRLGRSSISTRH
jgi:ribosome-associated protein